jgi:hypothetical protein
MWPLPTLLPENMASFAPKKSLKTLCTISPYLFLSGVKIRQKKKWHYCILNHWNTIIFACKHFTIFHFIVKL